ncbi:MAG: MinD/ParA family protein [Deltaproteobacteria bacterium]|nr:MinD/ParA family protein [Deltaproteobacteria bacterium]
MHKEIGHNAQNNVQAERQPPTRVISISSGKGGVGKTNTVANLAVALARLGKRSLLMDADLGLGNLDLLFGVQPEYNITHLLSGAKTIDEVLVKGPDNILILPAASGVQELTNLTADERLSLIAHLESLSVKFDIMLIDTGAGISDNVLFFSGASHDIMVVVTPHGASITDACALMKALLKKRGERSFKLLVNGVKSRKEGLEAYRNVVALASTMRLDISVDYLACVPFDENVRRSAARRMTVMEAFPESKASMGYEELARVVLDLPYPATMKGGMQFFWRRTFDAANRA